MTLDIRLDAHAARLFGVLIEKALTTPDQYPLSINAATSGANQKSNRDPVLSLAEDDVAVALQRLEQQYMARKVFPMNSRVEKYCHNGRDALGLDAAGLAVLAELLLRGPQTTGELRARAARMTAIESQEQLTGILATLMERGFVQQLAPLPGARAERYVQLLSPDLHPLEPQETPGANSAPSAGSEVTARVGALEAEVAQLRQQLRTLAEKLGHSLE